MYINIHETLYILQWSINKWLYFTVHYVACSTNLWSLLLSGEDLATPEYGLCISVPIYGSSWSWEMYCIYSISLYVHVFVGRYVCVCIYMYRCVRMFVYIYVCLTVHRCVYIYVYIYAHTSACVKVKRCVCVSVYVSVTFSIISMWDRAAECVLQEILQAAAMTHYIPTFQLVSATAKCCTALANGASGVGFESPSTWRQMSSYARQSNTRYK